MQRAEKNVNDFLAIYITISFLPFNITPCK